MCIAIAQPAGTPLLPKSMFERCHGSNRDGLGMAWIDWKRDPEHRIHIRRLGKHDGKFDVEHFWEKYRLVHQHWGKTSPIIIHFRLSTRGVINQYNCHPFRVKPTIAMMHNGILDLPEKGRVYKNFFEEHQMNPLYSDTWQYANLYFPRFHNLAFHTWLKADTEKFIGRNNKLVFLDANQYDEKLVKRHNIKPLVIYNEKEGVWDGGVWFSNYGYKPYTTGSYDWGDGDCCGFRGRSTSSFGKRCVNSKCFAYVYNDPPHGLCYTCNRALEQAEGLIKPVNSPGIVATLSEQDYDKEKKALSDTAFWPAVGSELPPTGTVLCSSDNCTSPVFAKNQHYCKFHFDQLVDARKAKAWAEKEAKKGAEKDAASSQQ